MNKNDKLKEELAESRHQETITVALAALGFGGISLGVALGLAAGWSSGIPMMSIVIVGWFVLSYITRRNNQERKDRMKQLDTQEQASKPQTTTP
jgi:hypothetical protein